MEATKDALPYNHPEFYCRSYPGMGSDRSELSLHSLPLLPSGLTDYLYRFERRQSHLFRGAGHPRYRTILSDPR